MDAVSSEQVNELIGPRQMLVDQVFDAILSLILDEKFSTGSALSIDGLAKRFRVSSTPVREALARLEMTGMVRREALRGYRVAPEPSSDDVEKIIESRELLEPAIARLAGERAPAGLVAELEWCNRELNDARGGQDFKGYRAYWKADELFHRKIAEAADNEFMLRAYSSIEGHIQRFRLMVQNSMSGEHTIEEHALIIDAFRSGDAADVERAMRGHIEGIALRARTNYAQTRVDS